VPSDHDVMQPPPGRREQPSTLEQESQTCSQLAPVSTIGIACQPAAQTGPNIACQQERSAATAVLHGSLVAASDRSLAPLTSSPMPDAAVCVSPRTNTRVQQTPANVPAPSSQPPSDAAPIHILGQLIPLPLAVSRVQQNMTPRDAPALDCVNAAFTSKLGVADVTDMAEPLQEPSIVAAVHVPVSRVHVMVQQPHVAVPTPNSRLSFDTAPDRTPTQPSPLPLALSSVQQQTSLQSALDLDSVDAASFASGLVIADSTLTAEPPPITGDTSDTASVTSKNARPLWRL
jgi:hypothetical protein